MSVTEVTRQTRHAWAIWVYALGFLAVIFGAVMAAYAPERSGVVVVLAAIVAAVVYAVVGWAAMRSVLRPTVQWDLYLANDAKSWINVVASQPNGLCTVSLNGERIAEHQSLKLMFDMDVKLEIPFPDHTAALLIRTPWFLRMKIFLDIDGERVVSA